MARCQACRGLGYVDRLMEHTPEMPAAWELVAVWQRVPCLECGGLGEQCQECLRRRQLRFERPGWAAAILPCPACGKSWQERGSGSTHTSNLRSCPEDRC
jgi:hypothetical protein